MLPGLPMVMRAIIRSVAGNPGLRRVMIALVGFTMAEWATWIAILVYAFNRGGVNEAALVALIQLIPATVVAPLAASLGDRYPRRRALLFAYLVQGATIGATALALALGAEHLVVYALAAASTASITLTRPTHGAILPSLARVPAELTAANAASGTIQNLGMLVAPVMTGLLLEVSGAAVVFAIAAAGLFAGAVIVAGVRPVAPGVTVDEPVEAPGSTIASTLGELAGGFRALAQLRGPRTIVALVAAASLVEGAVDVLIIVLALELLQAGESGVGALNAAIGAGGLVGAIAAFTLAGRTRLARPFAVGMLIAGLPLAIVGWLPPMLAIVPLFVLMGIGRSTMDVAARTLLQRATPDAALSRVLGVLEGLSTAMLGIGAVMVPVILAVAGPEATFLIAGLWLPLVALILWRPLRGIAATSVVRPHEIELLRRVPMLAPLEAPALERLAASLLPVQVEPGGWIIRQGERGDHFYVIGEGEVEVIIDGHPVRTQGPGDGFGEIALLRDVPRTASIRAVTPVRLFALSRRPFLEAVTGHATSRHVAELAVDELLTTSG